MSHIILSSKGTNKTPTFRELSSPSTNTPRTLTGQESWSAKMLSRIKGCRDTIKAIRIFDRVPDFNKIRSPFLNRKLSDLRTSSSSSMPDIVSSSTKTLLKETLISSASMTNILGTPSTDAQKKLDTHKMTNLPNDIPGDNTINSLSLYLTPTKNTNRIICDNKAFYIDESECTYVESPRGMKSESVSIKRKISAEPFLSYTKQSPHLFWNDDLDESLSQEKTGDNSNHFLEYYTKSSIDWSLASFLDHEKRLEEESLKRKNSLQETDKSDERISKPRCKDNLKEDGLKDSIDRDGELCSTKTTIATEPFIPSTKKAVEFSSNDDGHASFSTKRTDSLDLSNLSTVTFGGPCSSSTFCEDADVDRNILQLVPVPTSALKDSGFENNVSTLHDSP